MPFGPWPMPDLLSMHFCTRGHYHAKGLGLDWNNLIRPFKTFATTPKEAVATI